MPAFEGELLADPALLLEHSFDFGYHVHAPPGAVFRPRSAADIAQLVQFARRFRIPLAVRGQAHSTHGQSLAPGGVAIDMRQLNRIGSPRAGHVQVEAGALWRDVVSELVPLGYTLPVLTSYIGLSIGGTLSMGGISSRYAAGAQIDHVSALEIVTGEGRLVHCSPDRERALFEAALGGMGAVGVIVRATLALEAAPARMHILLAEYADAERPAFFADLRRLLARGEVDDILGAWSWREPNGWVLTLLAAKKVSAGQSVDHGQLVRELGRSWLQHEVSYLDYALRVDAEVDAFRKAGLWDEVVHPYLDVFVPGRQIEPFLDGVFPSLTARDVGPAGYMLLLPLRRLSFTRPWLRVPDDDEWIYLFDILGSNAVVGRDAAFARDMLARNRRLFEQARALGGVRYPIGSLEFSAQDWSQHYGERYAELQQLRRHYDPDGVFAVSQRLETKRSTAL